MNDETFIKALALGILGIISCISLLIDNEYMALLSTGGIFTIAGIVAIPALAKKGIYYFKKGKVSYPETIIIS